MKWEFEGKALMKAKSKKHKNNAGPLSQGALHFMIMFNVKKEIRVSLCFSYIRRMKYPKCCTKN